MTLVNWRKEDPEFASAYEKARCEMELSMLDAIEQASQSGHWQAAAWKLKRIFPERYARKSQPIAMAHEVSNGETPGKMYRVAIQPMETVPIAP